MSQPAPTPLNLAGPPSRTPFGSPKDPTGISWTWLKWLMNLYTALRGLAFANIAGLLGIKQIDASGTPSGTTFLRGDGSWSPASGGGGGGNVTRVAMTGDGTVYQSAVPGSPVTAAGTLAPALASQPPNNFLASPGGIAGGPWQARKIILADLPPLGAFSDGLIHGDAVWDIDPACVAWREDFVNCDTLNLSGLFRAKYPWSSALAAGTAILNMGGAPPHTGLLQIPNSDSANQSTWIVPGNLSSMTQQSLTQALFDYPSWKYVFEFQLQPPGPFVLSQLPPVPSFAKTRMYLGLMNWPAAAPITSSFHGRPPVFCGLRYDTDPGINVLSSASAGGTYAGTFPEGASNGLAGQTAVVTGFLTGVNNGSFAITASSATSIATSNGSSVSETHAAQAVISPIGDTSFVFECVTNIQAQSLSTVCQAQGNTFATGIVPTMGKAYRLEIECVAAGIVNFTLTDGTALVAKTLSMMTWSGTGVVVRGSPNGTAMVACDFASALSAAIGTVVTIASTVGTAGINGAQALTGIYSSGVSFNFACASINTDTNYPTATMSAYPSAFPFLSFGNDSQPSPTSYAKGIWLDSIAFVWNPGVNSAGVAPNPNPVLARYF
ncbi:MAG: hypothetical protein ACRD2O_00095 [Terriglobia bacterium]